MLEVNAVTKRYGQLTAVDGISFSAGKGETIGLLGPNGAGKTTTVSMVAGQLRPDLGEILIEGKKLQSDTDPVNCRRERIFASSRPWTIWMARRRSGRSMRRWNWLG
jgi:ABC-2 type transport system ATP-binding protein